MSRAPTGNDPAYRTVRAGQWLLQLVIVAAALWLVVQGSARAVIIAALGPVAFGPFSYARLRLQRWLAPGPAPSSPVDSAAQPRRPAPHAVPTTAARAWAVAVVGLSLDALMAVQLLTARTHDPWPALHGPGVTWVGPVWFSANALLALGCLGAALARGVGGVARWLVHRVRRTPATPPQPDLGRRQFVQQLGMLSVGTPFVVSLTGVRTSYDFRVQEHAIVLPSWPRHLDGLRVAHLSDIHVGGAMDRRRLLQVAALTNAARPDLVLHTGDFLTHRQGAFDQPLYEALAQVHAPLGQWACLGNHDFDDPPRLVRQLADAGVRTLRDEVATLRVGGAPLDIAGLDYVFRGTATPDHFARRMRRWPSREDTPRLLMNHDPSTFAALPPACADLVCSGHTHGGHVGIQLGPTRAVTVVGLLGLPDQGLFVRDDLRLFVTRCVGFYGYPMRLGIPPEIALLTLRAPAADRASAE